MYHKYLFYTNNLCYAEFIQVGATVLLCFYFKHMTYVFFFCLVSKYLQIKTTHYTEYE